MKPLIWLCLTLNLLALTGCIVAPYRDGGYYHHDNGRHRGDDRR